MQNTNKIPKEVHEYLSKRAKESWHKRKDKLPPDHFRNIQKLSVKKRKENKKKPVDN